MARALYYSRHLNQYRNRNGQPWPGQINGGGCDCWATIGTGWVRTGSHGVLRPTVPEFRDRSGNLDCPGHIGHIQRGCESYGIKVVIPHATSTGWGFGVPWQEVIDRLDRGYFVALPLLYGALPDSDRANTSFVGAHMFGLLPYRDGADVRGDDPIRDWRRWYKLAHLKAAAQAEVRKLHNEGRLYGWPRENVIAAFMKGVAR